MMNANTSFEEWEHHSDLWELLVLIGQSFNSIFKYFFDSIAFLLAVELTVLEAAGECFALSLGEGEDDAGVEAFAHDERDELAHFLGGSLLVLFVLLLFVLQHLVNRQVVFNHLDGFREVVFLEFSFLIDDQIDALSTCREQVVLQGSGPEVSVHHIARLLLDLDDPLTELARVWNCRRQERVLDNSGQQDDGLFPDHTSLLVAHVMNFVKNNPRHFSRHLTSVVKHTTQDFSGHH